MSRHVTPHATPRHATPRHTTSRRMHVTLRHATPRHATPRVTLRTSRHATRHVTPRRATLRYTVPRHATPRHATLPRVTPRYASRHITPRRATLRRTALRRAAQSPSCWCRGSRSGKTMATRSTHRLQAFGSMKKGDREKGPRTRPTLPAIPHAAPSLSGRRSPFPTSRGRNGHMAGERQGPCLQVWPPRRDTEEPRDLGGSQLSPQRTGGSRRWKPTCTASAP